MKTLRDKVKSTIRKFGLINPNDKVICAVSGGPDSIAMLYILSDLTEEMNFSIVCAHFNHKLRENESEEDEKFTAKISQKLNIPFFKGEKDIKTLSEGKNIEKTAREERYKFLQELKEKLNAQSVATGHTASDLVETAVFNLTKGTGIKGLRGFLPKRDFIIRPLFELTREEVEIYLHEKKIPFRTDSSNFSTKFSRNLIRLNVIPQLRKINPSIEKTYLKTASNIRELEDFIKAEVAKIASHTTFEEGKITVKLETLRKLHPFLLKETVKYLFNLITGETLNNKKLKLIESVIGKKDFKELDLKNGYYCYKDQFHFVMEKKGRLQKNNRIKIPLKTLPCEIETTAGKIIFSRESENAIFSFPEKEFKKGIYIKYREGKEWLSLPYGKKKLKKFFIEKKVPLKERNGIPFLVTEENEIIWIPNLYKKTYINENGFEQIYVRIISEPENTDCGK